ncbi:MAG TPA: bifunctional proline dehydrogenase/L-glutamate gamma-semialdehyde dehydrogenase, partial [Acidimicrobiales bacterium]
HVGITAMAKQFIAGRDVDEVVPVATKLWQRGFATTVDRLGEKTLTREQAQAYVRGVAGMLSALASEAPAWPSRPLLETDPWGVLPRVNLSIKPTAVSPHLTATAMTLGVQEGADALDPVMELASALHATVHLDTEYDEAKDATFALLRELGRRWPAVSLGCVVQAYRRDAEDDLRELIRWSAATLEVPLHVRLVKGAYWDHEMVVARANGWPAPVWDRKHDSDVAFEHCASVLLGHAGEVRPAIASHNLRSIAYAVCAARAAGLADHALEVQLLYGMAAPLHEAVREIGVRPRVYTPMGELVIGMAYLVRRLLENTANDSFVRQRFVEGKEIGELLDAGTDERGGTSDDGSEVPGATREGAVVAAFRNEPLAELRREPVRARLARAVEAVGTGLGVTLPVVIDGERVTTSMTLPSVDPARPDVVVAHSSVATTDLVNSAVDVALRAQPEWAARTMAERAAVMEAAADLYRAHKAELAALVAIEVGKPIAEADADVAEAVDFLRYYALCARGMEAAYPLVQVAGEHNTIRFRARGVGTVIAPWNFPLAIPTGMTAGALVAGNAVVFKPAEQSPAIGARMVSLLHEAGVPAGVLAYLPGIGEEIGPALVEHPSVSFVAFTGSRAVGLDINERAARLAAGQRTVKRVITEMGGKNALIVDSDADLDVAVPAVLRSAFGYAGQKCSAASRLIVVGDRADELLTKLAGAMDLLILGAPTDPATDVGPLIEPAAVARFEHYLDIGRRDGRVVFQVSHVPEPGWFVGPALVELPSAASALATDEVFAPLLAAFRVGDLDEAIAMANEVDYGLTAGIISRSPSHIAHAVARLEAGNVYVNRAITGAMVGRHPFGGMKLSGTGAKAGGADYLAQFVHPTVVCENTVRQGFTPDLA